MAGLSNEAELLGAMHIGRPMFPFFVGRSVYTEGFRIPFYTPRLTVDATDMTLKEQNGIV
eukprot:scaffold4383_cov61-Cyclotella_meneghiniana.AAC.3